MALSPFTVAVEQGTATFYCQCLTCDIIGWRVNGVPENKINSPNISTDEMHKIFGSKIYTGSIGTILEFNQTTVECVALFFYGTPSRVISPTVTLLIQGFKLLNVSISDICTGYNTVVITIDTILYHH